jgi:hypothetical protein
MPPRARSRSRAASGPAALSEGDVALLRERLDAGKKPRVMLLVDTALGAAGTSVPVVGFAEPAVGEFISVRLHDDVVPFSPAELSLPVRGRSAATIAAAPQPGVTSTPEPSPAPQPPSPAPLPLEAPEAPERPARLVAVPEPSQTPSTPAQPPTKVAARGTSRRSSRAGGFSVTLRFGGQSWTYESTRGGRRSAARPLNLGAVRAFAYRLDDPALRRDLQTAIDVCRGQAQSRAEALRAELERVEVELAELDE